MGKETIAIVDHCDTKGCYKKEITYDYSYKLKLWFDSKEKNNHLVVWLYQMR